MVSLEDLSMMWLLFFAVLGVIDFATSNPVKQDHFVKKSFTSIIQNLVLGGDNVVAAGESSVTAVAASLKRAWADPSTGGFNLNGPTGNAAVWQEAIRLDAANTAAGTPPATNNQEAYLQIQYFQSQENSSNNGIPGGVGNWATVLQTGQVYPTRFFQSQADDPTKNMSKLGRMRYQKGVDFVTTVQISPNPQQTIKSFGASGAWWPNFLNDFPPIQQQNLAQLLFSEDWLYLSGYRYNSKHKPRLRTPDHVYCFGLLQFKMIGDTATIFG